MKNVIESIEQHHKHNNTRKMYQTVNQFKKVYQHKVTTIRNKKGEMAVNTKEKAEIWKEYFDKLLNTEEPRELIKKGNKYLELIKYGGDKILNRIYELVRQIWEEERIPEEWKETIIVPINKKDERLV
jgi:hypothetical protein